MKIVAYFLAVVIALPASAQELSAADQAENDFLRVSPEVAAPADVEPIPGAVNVRWKHCEIPADIKSFMRAGRSQRDVYGYVRAQNVIETLDCGCTGKVVTMAQVLPLWQEFEDKFGAPQPQHTDALYEESERLAEKVRVMCGGGV